MRMVAVRPQADLDFAQALACPFGTDDHSEFTSAAAGLPPARTELWRTERLVDDRRTRGIRRLSGPA
jgi:hypothetical protein